MIIASLATIPSRIKFIQPVIESLLNQTYPPDEIHLQLPHYCVKEQAEYEIPEFLEKYEKVKIRRIDKDFGAANKWLPAIEECKVRNTSLIIVDDDCFYPRDAFFRLHERYKVNVKQAYCLSGGKLFGSKIQSLRVGKSLRRNTLNFLISISNDIQVDTVQGFGGVLFDPSLISDVLLERLKGSDLRSYNDDILLSSLFESCLIDRVQVVTPQLPIPLPQASIHPIHGHGRLKEMSFAAFRWIKKEFNIWDAYEFLDKGRRPFQHLKKTTKVVIPLGRIKTLLKYKRHSLRVLWNYVVNRVIPRANTKYLFILGAAHTGTTLLNEVLSSSTNASSNNNKGTREGQLLPTVRDHMFSHKQQWEENLDFNWYLVKSEWMKYWDITRPILIEKSPPNLLRARSIERIFNPSYFVILVRDPYAHCESFIRKNNYAPADAARFVINTLKFQRSNLEQLENVVVIPYELIVDQSVDFTRKITEFLPELCDIQIDKKFTAHNFHNKSHKLKNFNEEKISRLTLSQLNEINTVLRENQDYLHFFGYTLRDLST